MFPTIFQIGPIGIHTYGLLIFIGYWIASDLSKKLANENGMDPNAVSQLVFNCLIAGFIGARLLFVYTQWNEYQQNPLEILKFWQGGFVFFGGLVLVVPYVLWFAAKRGWNGWTLADVLVPCLAVGHAFGRLGCFAAGCCYGKPTDSVFGVRFNSDLVEVGLRGVPLHPTQLYESVGLFILFGVLMFVRKRRQFRGQVGLIYFLTYPILRSIIETFRGDDVRGFVFNTGISTSQFISIFAFILALSTFIYRYRQVRSA